MPTDRAYALVAGDIRDGNGVPLDQIALEAFAATLDAWCPGPPERPFGVRRSSVTGLLDGAADPLRPILAAALAAGDVRVRWSIAVGRPGDALVARAEGGVALARAARDGLIVRTGEHGTDRLLGAIAPLLAELLAELTDRQREVARVLVLEGRRQADAADSLGISRATVSVMAARGRIRAIERLAEAIRETVRAGVGGPEEAGGRVGDREAAGRVGDREPAGRVGDREAADSTAVRSSAARAPSGGVPAPRPTDPGVG